MGQARRQRRIDQSRVASRTSEVDRLGDNDDNWHYKLGLEENSGRIGDNGQILGYFTFEVYNPELDATVVIAMNSDKKVNGEQGINVLLRDISKILFPNNRVNVPVIK